MRDIKPLLIGMLALGLVGTWAYHLYDKTRYTRIRNTVFVRDSAAIAEAVHDSLSRSFGELQRGLDAQLDSTLSLTDSIQQNLRSRVREINRLKSEIAAILNRQSVSRSELDTARQKILELQTSVSGLSQQNLSMEEEKIALRGMLDHLSRNADSLQQNITRLNQENAGLMEKISHGAYFIASEIKLSAVTTRGERDTETNSVRRADKLLVRFVIQNNIHQYDNEAIQIIIQQPNNQILQNLNWNSGNFTAKDGSTKKFTRVIRFDYERGERKELRFTLNPEEFERGQYILQLYHRGVLVGQATTTLT